MANVTLDDASMVKIGEIRQMYADVNGTVLSKAEVLRMSINNTHRNLHIKFEIEEQATASTGVYYPEAVNNKND